MKPTIGRIVNAVIKNKDGELVVRPAIIVRVWSDTTINAQVFCDGDGSMSNDGLPNANWKTSLIYEESAANGMTWHWPKRD